MPVLRFLGRSTRRLSWLAALATFVASVEARAEPPIRTWGADPDASSATDPPPTPPPISVGTPVEGAEAKAPTPTTALGTGAPTARLDLRYSLEGVEIHGNTSTLKRVILRYVPFHAGDTFDVEDERVGLTRFRLLGTGYFRDVQLSLKRGSRHGAVVLVIDVIERNTIVVHDLWLGLASDVDPGGIARPITAYGGIDASEHNLAGTGLLLGGAVAVADRQLGLRARFAAPQLGTSPFGVNAQLLFNHARDFFGNRDVLVTGPAGLQATDYAVVTYDRFGGSVGGSYEVSPTTHLFLDYRLEKIDASVPTAASHVRGRDVEPIDFYVVPGGSVLSTLRGTLTYDTRDEPILTGRGSYLGLVGELSLSPLGSSYPYGRVQARVDHWISLPWHHVLHLDAFAGALLGEAPLYERYYVGDFTSLLPDRVLDLAFDRRSAPNFFGTSIAEVRYGQYAAQLGAEYRIPLYRGRAAVYGIDLFASVGVYGIAELRSFTQPPSGYRGFSRVPLDLDFNLGLRVDTAVGGIRLGVSTLVGFIPFRTEGQ